MKIDLQEGQQMVRNLMDEFGLADKPSCITIDLWDHKRSQNTLSLSVTIFNSADNCERAEGPDWQSIIDQLRVLLIGKSREINRDEPLVIETENL